MYFLHSIVTYAKVIIDRLIHFNSLVNYVKVSSLICSAMIINHNHKVGDSMKYSEIYAFRIKQLCANRGITINRLATLSGLKQSTIDNIIRGTSKNPKIHTLHRIAVTFNMTLSEFLDFQELNEYPIDDEDEEED